MSDPELLGEADSQTRRAFMRALLDDVQALERLCAEGRIESGVRRIGAEQEMFLVDRTWRPAPLALAMLEALDSPAYTPELARFNLEANMAPRELCGDCLSSMEREIRGLAEEAQAVARSLGGDVVLTGILPTLEKQHLTLENMSPKERYISLNRVMSELRGSDFLTYIKGLDELQTRHDNVMLEACNTSFQVHFQVGAEEFARFYNLAQLVTAPVLAVAVNSPVLLQHRLWHETRVALFQQSLDSRSETQVARGGQQRVSFGERWVERSVLEIFREDIARFRVLLSSEVGESSMDALERGEIPPLTALCLHNGTVYRWNRPCYGAHAGVAHLRIENRALPAGPTVVDEVANAAFYFGLMAGMAEEHPDVTQVMSFDHAKENFMAAARYGLKAQFHWLRGEPITARELILERLLPVARAGLGARAVDPGDVERYLGIIEERTRSGQTGAQWMLDSLAAMGEGTSKHARYGALTACLSARQTAGQPVHTWELAREEEEVHDWRESFRSVGQVMQTDLYTVHPEDLVDLAASVMDWEHIRHVPVEDHEGRLVGLVSHRSLLRLLLARLREGSTERVAVREIMKADPVHVSPDTSALDAIEVMRRHKVGCLPVVQEGTLVGLVTEGVFIEVARRLLEEQLRRD